MVKQRITFAEMKNCIDMAVELCFEENEYQPYMKDYAVWLSLMSYYTDQIKDGMSLEEQYKVVLDDYLREEIMSYSQPSHIYEAILETIDIKVKKEIRKTRLDKIIDTLIETVNNPETLEKINEWIEEIATVEKDEAKDQV